MKLDWKDDKQVERLARKMAQMTSVCSPDDLVTSKPLPVTPGGSVIVAQLGAHPYWHEFTIIARLAIKHLGEELDANRVPSYLGGGVAERPTTGPLPPRQPPFTGEGTSTEARNGYKPSHIRVRVASPGSAPAPVVRRKAARALRGWLRSKVAT